MDVSIFESLIRELQSMDSGGGDYNAENRETFSDLGVLDIGPLEESLQVYLGLGIQVFLV